MAKATSGFAGTVTARTMLVTLPDADDPRDGHKLRLQYRSSGHSGPKPKLRAHLCDRQRAARFAIGKPGLDSLPPDTSSLLSRRGRPPS